MLTKRKPSGFTKQTTDSHHSPSPHLHIYHNVFNRNPPLSRPLNTKTRTPVGWVVVLLLRTPFRDSKMGEILQFIVPPPSTLAVCETWLQNIIAQNTSAHASQATTGENSLFVVWLLGGTPGGVGDCVKQTSPHIADPKVHETLKRCGASKWISCAKV